MLGGSFLVSMRAFLPASVPPPPWTIQVDVVVFSCARRFPLAVEGQTTVVEEALPGDEPHGVASGIHLAYLKQTNPSRLCATMPGANGLGCLLERTAADGEPGGEREIEADADKDEHQKGRLKQNGKRNEMSRHTPAPNALNQQGHGSRERRCPEQETAVEVEKVLEHGGGPVAGAEECGAPPEKGRA